MGFESEREMKKVALEALSDGFDDGPTVILDEFPYANGRADIVLAKASEEYLKQRVDILGISSSIQENTHLQVFLQLHGRGPITKEHFYTVGATERRKKEEALNWLIESGFVEELKNGKVRTAPYLRRHITTSYSIELKLGKWRQALEQAIRGKAFADYQFVALDEENILRAINNIDTFKENGVGLMEIKPDGEYFVHCEPEKESPYSPMNKWRLNETTIKEELPCSVYTD